MASELVRVLGHTVSEKCHLQKIKPCLEIYENIQTIHIGSFLSLSANGS